MKIAVSRSGGIGGVRVSRSVDTERLEPDEARALEELVSASQFFELPPVLRGTSPRPDRYEYRLEVELGGRTHAVIAREELLPEALRRLAADVLRR